MGKPHDHNHGSEHVEEARHGRPGEIEVPGANVGEADVRASRAVAQALHSAIPASQLVLLPGVGHVSNVEAPEPFNAAVRQFLQEVSNPSLQGPDHR